jgi:hypothetical protein
LYRINILPEPEIFNGKAMFFWMIESNGCNFGHGWSESILSAAVDADKCYREVIKRG